MVKVTKGGRGKIGQRVKAPHGKYIHTRKARPVKGARYVTIRRGGKTIRLMKRGRGPFKVQSVLTRI